MSFEKFVPQKGPSSDDPQVTIRKTGLISFDAAAVREFDLASYSHLVLFYDKGKKLLGVRMTKEGEIDGAIPLSRRRRTVSVKVPQFFERWGMLLEDIQKFSVHKDKEDAMLTVDLGAIKRRRGRRPKS